MNARAIFPTQAIENCPLKRDMGLALKQQYNFPQKKNKKLVC